MATYPTVEDILRWNPNNDPSPPVVTAMLTAWEESFFPPAQGHDPDESLCSEQGGWIYKGPNGKFDVVRSRGGHPGLQSKPVGNAITIDLNTPAYLDHPDWVLVCTFHTHPLSSEDPVLGNEQPSIADQDMAVKRGLPGIVLSRTGFWKYGPESRERSGANPHVYVYEQDPPEPPGAYTAHRVGGTPLPDRAPNQWEPKPKKAPMSEAAKAKAMLAQYEAEGIEVNEEDP